MSTQPDIFLSYNREDQAIVRRFAEAFERAGFSVWWDATLRSGEAYDQVTEKALKEAKAVVVLWSKKSVESRWVRAEATMADRNKTLMPVMIEACERPIMFELTHTADLCHWKGDEQDKAWLAFVNDVRSFVHNGEHTTALLKPGTAPLQRRKPGLLIALGVAALLVAGTAAWALLREAGSPAPAKPNPTAAVATITDKSIAVLPLDDFSAKGDEAYFADGLTEEILTALSRTPDLLVASRTSSFQYKGKTVDIKQVAKELNVAHVLEGSVRRTTDRLRVTVQLIRAADGFHLWSENYDRKPDDLIAVQEDIAFQIATALKTAMDPAALKQMVQAGTKSVAAYNTFLQGVALTRTLGGSLSREAYEKYELARQIDPGFARAHARAAGYWQSQLQPNIIRTQVSAQESTTLAQKKAFQQERIQLAINSAKAPELLLYRMQQAQVNVQLKAAFSYAEQYLALNNADVGTKSPDIGIVLLMHLFGKQEVALALLKQVSDSPLIDALAASQIVNIYFSVSALDQGRDYALAMVKRYPFDQALMYQTHRLLLSGGHVEEARKILEKVNGTDLTPDSIRLMRLRQACAENDAIAAKGFFDEILGTSDKIQNASTIVWQARHLMGRIQEATEQLRPLDQPDALYGLYSLMFSRFFDISQYPNLKAALIHDGVPLPVYQPIPYACKAPQPNNK